MKSVATDDVGVTSVQFLVNGKLFCQDNSSPYVCRVRVKKNRILRLEVRAFDKAGNVGNATAFAFGNKQKQEDDDD